MEPGADARRDGAVRADGATAVAVPDLITPVIGYRLWRLHDGALWSPFAGTRWAIGRNAARCILPDVAHAEPAPAAGCTCGLYAWHRPCPWLAWAGTAELVAGAVALWGALEVHRHGVRAQYAMVVALALPPARVAKRRRVIDLARTLEAPVVPARRLMAEALRHGRPLDARLLPPAGPLG